MTAFMMPMIGKLLTRGVKPQYLVAAGMLVFFVYSFWGFRIISPDTGKDDFFWMLIARGVGLGLLFIPITALSLSSLKGREIGEGAAFTGMMRQLGGSFGIAVITTVLSAKNMVHRNELVAKLNVNDLNVQQRIAGMQKAFISKGLTPDVALKASYKAMDYSVTKQAAVLSYMDIFLYLGFMFLLCLPIVFFVKQKKNAAKPDLADAMH